MHSIGPNPGSLHRSGTDAGFPGGSYRNDSGYCDSCGRAGAGHRFRTRYRVAARTNAIAHANRNDATHCQGNAHTGVIAYANRDSGAHSHAGADAPAYSVAARYARALNSGAPNTGVRVN